MTDARWNVIKHDKDSHKNRETVGWKVGQLDLCLFH